MRTPVDAAKTENNLDMPASDYDRNFAARMMQVMHEIDEWLAIEETEL